MSCVDIKGSNKFYFLLLIILSMNTLRLFILFVTSHYDQDTVNTFLYIIFETRENLGLCLHKNECWPQYLNVIWLLTFRSWSVIQNASQNQSIKKMLNSDPIKVLSTVYPVLIKRMIASVRTISALKSVTVSFKQ